MKLEFLGRTKFINIFENNFLLFCRASNPIIVKGWLDFGALVGYPLCGIVFCIFLIRILIKKLMLYAMAPFQKMRLSRKWSQVFLLFPFIFLMCPFIFLLFPWICHLFPSIFLLLPLILLLFPLVTLLFPLIFFLVPLISLLFPLSVLLFSS